MVQAVKMQNCVLRVLDVQPPPPHVMRVRGTGSTAALWELLCRAHSFNKRHTLSRLCKPRLVAAASCSRPFLPLDTCMALLQLPPSAAQGARLLTARAPQTRPRGAASGPRPAAPAAPGGRCPTGAHCGAPAAGWRRSLRFRKIRTSPPECTNGAVVRVEEGISLLWWACHTAHPPTCLGR